MNAPGNINVLPHFLIGEGKNQYVVIEIIVITEVKSAFSYVLA